MASFFKSLKNFFVRTRTIRVVYPKGWMNCAVTTTNRFISDTNDSAHWDYISIPLPKPKHKWHIKSYVFDETLDKKIVILIDKR